MDNGDLSTAPGRTARHAVDSLTVDTIRTIHYTRFLPDDLLTQFLV